MKCNTLVTALNCKWIKALAQKRLFLHLLLHYSLYTISLALLYAGIEDLSPCSVESLTALIFTLDYVLQCLFSELSCLAITLQLPEDLVSTSSPHFGKSLKPYIINVLSVERLTSENDSVHIKTFLHRYASGSSGGHLFHLSPHSLSLLLDNQYCTVSRNIHQCPKDSHWTTHYY